MAGIPAVDEVSTMQHYIWYVKENMTLYVVFEIEPARSAGLKGIGGGHPQVLFGEGRDSICFKTAAHDQSSQTPPAQWNRKRFPSNTLKESGPIPGDDLKYDDDAGVRQEIVRGLQHRL